MVLATGDIIRLKFKGRRFEKVIRLRTNDGKVKQQGSAFEVSTNDESLIELLPTGSYPMSRLLYSTLGPAFKPYAVVLKVWKAPSFSGGKFYVFLEADPSFSSDLLEGMDWGFEIVKLLLPKLAQYGYELQQESFDDKQTRYLLVRREVPEMPMAAEIIAHQNPEHEGYTDPDQEVRTMT